MDQVTLLQVMPAEAPGDVRLRSDDQEVIRRELLWIGVRFGRWHAAHRLPADADDAAITRAYRCHIDHVRAESGYRAVEIARLPQGPDGPAPAGHVPSPAGPDQPFCEDCSGEHLHEEDLVRFVVAGSACFFLHVSGAVHAVLCTAGDLLSVPGRTAHWFDAGADPRYTAVRFRQDAGGGGTRSLPNGLAARFPGFDALAASR
ncbi:1,2-dihydroxy-3-keto-5-methylthiopentene dioxygenase [Streptomyces sp. 1222.5]|nr:1,2-dihydroxy-3-keto-5-methylthiopentene dioxygenase [Streptomyces sp. 5112.2]SEB94573.1 1,2-dihydroxy-3-keto-5-methylthiopentene dioxygenase [Streptomyces sp. 1222.5]